MNSASKQAGFTLVEIAIVLVIIGLLLGGVLKGQEMIDSAKAKSLARDFSTVSALVNAYQDRFRSWPGDQTQAQLDAAFGTGTAAACAPAAAGICAQNNGRLDGNWNAGGAGTGVATDETSVFWQHVRLANMATGTAALANIEYRPRNADGGFLGIESGVNAAGQAAPYIAGMRGAFFVCSAGVQGRYLQRLDTMMDDGNPGTGSVQAVLDGSARATAGVALAAVVAGAQYTVCAAF